jgi:hypothetical protein
MTARGRPRGSLGPESRAALSLAAERAVTYMDVHRELQLSRRHASQIVRQGRRDGWLMVVGSARLPGALRPVLQVRAAPATVEAKLDALADLAAWSRRLRTLP